MKRIIHIYGASGSGTSTLGKTLCHNTGYYFMDADDYYWLPSDPMYTKKREIPARIKLMNKAMRQHDTAVICGSFVDWGDVFIPNITLAVRVVTDTAVRIERLKDREYKTFGDRIRSGGDMYQAHMEFLDWAARYDTGDIDMRSKANHDLWEKKLHCPIITVNGADKLEENIELIKKSC